MQVPYLGLWWLFLFPQARLISLYFDTKCYQEALQLGELADNWFAFILLTSLNI